MLVLFKLLSNVNFTFWEVVQVSRQVGVAVSLKYLLVEHYSQTKLFPDFEYLIQPGAN